MATDAAIGSVLVTGCGLIGTSVALALREHGVAVHLADRDGSAVRTAERLGAGTAEPPTGPVDVALVAVSPATTAEVVIGLLERGAARTVSDTASIKGAVLRAVQDRLPGPSRQTYVGGHPMAGSERSGPAAARADLFAGRSWVLTPEPATEPASIARARRLVELCGAVSVEVDADVHDRDMAVLSHLPQVVASALAAPLASLPPASLRLAGPGLHDMTRLAASQPELWTEILLANRTAVLAAMESLHGELDQWVSALEEAAADPAGAGTALRALLVDGNRGRARLGPVPGARPGAGLGPGVGAGEEDQPPSG